MTSILLKQWHKMLNIQRLLLVPEPDYISWLQIAVLLTAIAVIISAFAAVNCKMMNACFSFTLTSTPIVAIQSVSLVLLAIALLFDAYALRACYVHIMKNKTLKDRQ